MIVKATVYFFSFDNYKEKDFFFVKPRYSFNRDEHGLIACHKEYSLGPRKHFFSLFHYYRNIFNFFFVIKNNILSTYDLELLES